MSSGQKEYASLMDALLENTALCDGDDRFIMDDSNAALLMQTCTHCPVLTLCRTYAETVRPEGGVWAGKRYPKNTTKAKEQ